MKLHKTKIDNEIYYYYLKNGTKRWMYRHKYYDVLGKRKEKKESGFTTEKAALKALLELKAAILSGQTRHIEHSQLTVSSWLDIWYETKKRSWKVSTDRINKNAIKHLKRLIGRYRIVSLTSSTYEREFINKMFDKGFSPQSVLGFHEVFKTAINSAVDDEILNRNRFVNVKIELDEKLDNFLTPEELNLFLDASKKYGDFTQYTLILLLAYTGFRKGEALGLMWKNIDFEKRTITVERTRDDDGVRSPKTKNSYRTIKVEPAIINQLDKYQKWCIETKLSYGLHLDKENDFVFITEGNIDGIYSGYINHFFKKLYRYLESDEIDIKKITPHGLRHTHATILIDELTPPADVAARLGNTLELIYRVYAHSINKTEDKAVFAFSNRLKKANE